MKVSGLRLVALLSLFLAVIVSTGCGVSKGKYNTLMDERDALAGERDSLAIVVEEQDEELAALEADYNQLGEIFADEIVSKEIQLRMLVDGIEVAIPTDLMYESGSATATIGRDGK